jgi:polyhydroxybutyrate depolymerase
MEQNRKSFFGLLFITLTLLPVFVSAGTLYERNRINAPDGRTRYFHYYVPARLIAQPPLVILLHGGSQNYSSILRRNSAQREWLRLADENGFLLIIPNGVDAKTGTPSGTNQHWNDCRSDAPEVETGADDVGFIRKLIDWSIRKYGIDATRVYAVGASNGGMMSYRLAAELSNRIAAIAAFVANLPLHSECADPDHPRSIFIANGTADTWMPWSGGTVIKGGKVSSAIETRDYWILQNQTNTIPSQRKKYRDLDFWDRSTVHSELFTSGLEGTEVMFYKVKGGGHTIPSISHRLSRTMEWIVGRQNHDIEGAREAWNFLSRQTLK